MNTIWKFPLKIKPRQIIKAPSRINFLHVANQNGKLCFWAEVDSSQEKVDLNIYVIGTGHQMDMSKGIYLGSAVIDPFVWHVYRDMTGADVLGMGR